MAKPLSSMNKDMKAFAKRFEDRANMLMVEAVAVSGTQVANDNPVLTGLSSGNWQASVGSPITSAQERYYPTASEDAMLSFESTKRKTGQNLYLANNIPYIDDLARGTSPKAQAGWIRRAIKRAFRTRFKNAKIVGK